MIKPIRVDKNSSFDIFCGRPSKYSNPFIIGKDGNRKEVLGKYKNYLNNMENFNQFIEELDNKKLACWCSLDQECHVDLLIDAIVVYEKMLLINGNLY